MTLVRCNNRGALAPWTPFTDFDRLFGRMSGENAPMANPAGGTWVPAIDIRETEDSYLIEADVPGLKKDDIELTVEDNVLTLKGERNHESEEKKEGYRRMERRYGSFRRSFELPAGVDTGKVKADFKDGVLSVTLPKPEEVKPKQIEVNYN